MDEKYIAYETLVAGRQSADWAYYSMIAAFISAISAIATVLIASKALSSWKEQEEVKLRYAFKNSAHKYLSCLYVLPEDLTEEFKATHYEYVSRLMDAYEEVNRSWIMLERMFDSTPIEKHWKAIGPLHNLYIRGGVEQCKVAEECKSIISSDMVFLKPKKFKRCNILAKRKL